MFSKKLEQLFEIASKSHARVQQNFQDVNPMIGVNQQMREMGVPCDVMTIDCLQSKKRIILVLHDHNPDIVRYLLSHQDVEPEGEFEEIPYRDVTEETLYKWIIDYFQ